VGGFLFLGKETIMILIDKDKKKNKSEEKASNRPNTYKRFSRATVSKFGFPAKISKSNFTEAINEIAKYIFENRNDNIELTKELVLLEAKLSNCQVADDIDASLRDTISQFKTIIVSMLSSVISVFAYVKYGTNPSVIVATIIALLGFYFVLYFACTVGKGQTETIFDTNFSKAIAITISDIIKYTKDEKDNIKQDEIKAMICTNMANLQNK
jgi:hypothetical protein